MSEVKTEIVDQDYIEFDYYPEEMKDELQLMSFQSYEINDILAYGGLLANSMSEIVKIVKNNKGTAKEILCKVKCPKNFDDDLKLMKKNNGKMSGTIMEGSKIAAQADLVPVGALSAAPTVFANMAVAAALMKVEKSLDGIEDVAKEILEFLELKEKSEMQGNLNTLADIMKTLKYNYGQELFISNKHQVVLDIKRDSEAKIVFYRHQVEANLKRDNKKDLIYHKTDVDKKVKAILNDFNNYHMAMYIFAYATFLEVMLQGNFNSAYLTTVNESLIAKDKEYTILYKNCIRKIDVYSKGSVESQALKALGHVAKGAGDVLQQVPIANRTPIDEALQAHGKDIKKFAAASNKKAVDQLRTKRDSGIDLFVNNINALDQLYSQRRTFWIDDNRIYYQK
ncbi:MAG: hypothetical protein J6P61_09865 [Erysipelotrichaceae bacterium]|nr:hypothetical protein [Erysipelotrichaceae bacterium]